MTTQDPELSAALGWPGGISDPVLDRTRLLQMVVALRLTSKQALEALEYRDGDGADQWKADVITALRAALAQEQTEPDISRCPQCNGPADNGFDRSFPPSPYLCTKCMAEPVEQVKTCAWRDNLDAIYETACGNLHIVNDGTLEENGMKYCCYCGKEIEDESPK